MVQVILGVQCISSFVTNCPWVFLGVSTHSYGRVLLSIKNEPIVDESMFSVFDSITTHPPRWIKRELRRVQLPIIGNITHVIIDMKKLVCLFNNKRGTSSYSESFKLNILIWHHMSFFNKSPQTQSLWATMLRENSFNMWFNWKWKNVWHFPHQLKVKYIQTHICKTSGLLNVM